MTASNYLYVIAMGLGVMGWGTWVYAEGDVTIVSPPVAATNLAPQKAIAPAGTPVIHKSLHKTATPTATASSIPKGTGNPSTAVPAVETSLPVARHTGTGDVSDFTPIPATVTLPSAKFPPGVTSHQTLASVLPPLSPTVPGAFPATSMYSVPSGRTTTPSDSFAFPTVSKKPTHTYPWKTGIITTEFWIGEGGTTISSTTNIGSAWDENWRRSNHGTDNPDDRSGYAPADHAATVNPFYVALPFNDLAYPDEARRWVPSWWHRPPKDGKQVSACKDRWVEIKSAQGRTCYAQWEDVGPLVSDHPEYVFGNERPDTLTRAGLDVSPAVMQYLGLDGKNRITSWRFVDDEDVPPGYWLKYDELALLYSAMHQMKNGSPSSLLPIQKASEPIDDPSSAKSNKTKVGAAKG